MNTRNFWQAAFALFVVVAASGCGEQSISAQSPLYVLVDDGGSLAIDVLNQSDFQVAGKINLVSVGNAPPSGALAAIPGGQVLVTYTGVSVNQQSQLSPSTESCSLASSQCTTVWSGWGSATAKALDDSSVAVPAWDAADVTSGRLAFFGGSGLSLTRQLQLVKSMPGPVTLSNDGQSLYWITYPPPTGGSPVEQELVRVSTATGAVESRVGFGKRLPYAVTTDSAGNVLVSILYDVAPLRSAGAGGPPPAGVYGSEVEVFSPDLSSSRSVGVLTGPSMIAVAGTTMLLTGIGSANPAIAVYDLASGAKKNEVDLSSDWTLSGLDAVRLMDGSSAGIVLTNHKGNDRFRLGVVDLNSGSIVWHEFSGQALGSVAA